MTSLIVLLPKSCTSSLEDELDKEEVELLLLLEDSLLEDEDDSLLEEELELLEEAGGLVLHPTKNNVIANKNIFLFIITHLLI